VQRSLFQVEDYIQQVLRFAVRRGAPLRVEKLVSFYLKVGSTVVIAAPTNVAPNTRITAAAVSLVLNAQIAFSTPETA
jgi:hypothetical protein